MGPATSGPPLDVDTPGSSVEYNIAVGNGRAASEIGMSLETPVVSRFSTLNSFLNLKSSTWDLEDNKNDTTTPATTVTKFVIGAAALTRPLPKPPRHTGCP